MIGMDWVDRLMFVPTASQLIFLLSLSIALGIFLGRVRILGVSLGIAGVLFAGMALGRLFPGPNMELLKFIREFGLILFVYAISVHVGPSFFSAFRKGGFTLNMLAVAIVTVGMGLTLVLNRILHLDVRVTAGLMAGAVTNTPSLAAAQELLKEMEVSGLAYALAYPMGVTGTILSIVLLRTIFRINVPAEVEAFRKNREDNTPRPQNLNVEILNPGMQGKTLEKLLSFGDGEVRASRMLREDQTMVPARTTALRLRDVLHLVGTKEALDKVRVAAGDASELDLRRLPTSLSSRKVLVTHADVIGTAIGELETKYQSEVAVTRVERAGVEFVPTPSLKLQFGDSVTVVGLETNLRKFSLVLGNSEKKMSEPNVIGVFVGILIGVVIGNIPFHVPGLPGEIKLGLAGGPLIAGIVLSRLGSLGPIHWYLPTTANLAIREIGIALFLACIGLSSGRLFTREMMSPEMFRWVAGGVVVTMAPLLFAGITARLLFKANFTAIAGLLAGGMTAPAALSFANTVTDSEAPAISYATVYPLAMVLRVVSIQMLILFLQA